MTIRTRASEGQLVSHSADGLFGGFGGRIRFVLSAVLLVGLGLLIDWGKLTTAARALAWPIVVLAGVTLLVQVAVGAWRAQAFLRMAGSHADLLLVLQVYALSVIANAFLFNFVAGAIARTLLLQRHQVAVSTSIATIVAEKVLIFATLGCLALAAIVILAASGPLGSSYTRSVLLLVLGSGIVAGAALTARHWSKIALALLPRITRDTVAQCASVLSLKSAWLVGAGSTCLSLLCAWAAYTMLASEIGIEAAGPRIALVLPLVAMAASLPISIGGWGVRELSFGALLLGFGVPTEQSVIVPALASLLAVAAAFATVAAVWIVRRRID